MKSKGVQFVQFLGAYQQSARLAQAMQSGGFKPTVLMYDPSVYEAGFLKQGGTAVEGAKFFVNFTPLNESQTELNLYKKWLGQANPGAQPTFFGIFAWSAAKLFVEKALALGGQLTRVVPGRRLQEQQRLDRRRHARADVGRLEAPAGVRTVDAGPGRRLRVLHPEVRLRRLHQGVVIR